MEAEAEGLAGGLSQLAAQDVGVARVSQDTAAATVAAAVQDSSPIAGRVSHPSQHPLHAIAYSAVNQLTRLISEQTVTG